MRPRFPLLCYTSILLLSVISRRCLLRPPKPLLLYTSLRELLESISEVYITKHPSPPHMTASGRKPEESRLARRMSKPLSVCGSSRNGGCYLSLDSPWIVNHEIMVSMLFVTVAKESHVLYGSQATDACGDLLSDIWGKKTETSAALRQPNHAAVQGEIPYR